MRAVVLMMLGAALLAGCGKKADPVADASAPMASVSADASAPMASAGGTAVASAAPTGAARAFAGKYTVSAGTMYVPTAKDWSNVKFKNDEQKMLGDGELSLAIDAAGRVSGSTDGGPLGASIVDGNSDGSTLAATIRRKDANDSGLTGTLVASIVGDKLEGTMKLSEFNAAVVRIATFTATKK